MNRFLSKRKVESCAKANQSKFARTTTTILLRKARSASTLVLFAIAVLYTIPSDSTFLSFVHEVSLHFYEIKIKDRCSNTNVTYRIPCYTACKTAWYTCISYLGIRSQALRTPHRSSNRHPAKLDFLLIDRLEHSLENLPALVKAMERTKIAVKRMKNISNPL